VFEAGGDIPDSGVSRYELEGDYTDSWGSNNGNAVNSPTFTNTSKYGTQAVETDADAVNTSIGSLSTPFSIAVWINPQTVSTGDHFFGNYNDSQDDVFLWDAQSGVWEIIDDNGGNLTGPSISTGSFELLTYTRSDSRSRLYVGSTQEAESTGLSATTYSSGGNFWFGGAPDNGGELFQHAIFDNFDVYDKELTSGDVSDLQSTGYI
jgi:hypothetical protein